jgi:glucarate dehydratase
VRDGLDYFYYLAQGTPDELCTQCADGVERGYSWFYLKVGLDAQAEEGMLEAVRAAIGPSCHIRIDANEAWSVPEAARLLERWNARFGLDLAEAPVPIFPLERMRDLRSRTGVALCANEGLGSAAEAYQVIVSGVADVVCFSSYWVGTLRRFHMLASLADLLGIGVCKHTHGELGIAAAAAHQLMLTLPSAVPGAQQTAAIMADDLLATPLPIATGPSWGVPDGPGLGVAVDEARLARFAADYRRHGQFLPYAA